MKYLATVFLVCVMMILPVLPKPARAAAGCSLCILEVQTQGTHGEEDQDFVVIANVSGTTITASSTNPIRLQYYNDQGIASVSMVVAAATIPKDQVLVFASSTLTTLNTSAQTLAVPLYSGGGSLQISRGTTIYDKVGWGSARNVEVASALAPDAGATLARKQTGGFVQDTNDNSQDFYSNTLQCKGQEIQEIQPFVTDDIGQSEDAWVEVASTGYNLAKCWLVTKAGDLYQIPDSEYAMTGLNVVSRGIDADGRVVPLHLGEVSGQVWIAAVSAFANVRLPVAARSYSNLENGQSYARVDGIWRRTYALTPGLANVYASSGLEQDDPTACAAVRISEVLPNPVGEDAGEEWIEIINEGDQPAPLGNCAVEVGGVAYRFLPDDRLGLHEWRAVYDFYDGDQKPKSLSLRNGGSTLVALDRVRADATTETLQSFEYADAPEGQAWARFADGWRWVYPTPDAENVIGGTTGGHGSGPTELPADSTTRPGSEQQASDSLAHLSITELLPNPAAPTTDDADEFVELYNDGDEPVDLHGYKLQTGNSYSYSFTFTDQIIDARSYLAITSGASSISLANSGGRARLLNAEGEVVYETLSYADAPEGQSWAFLDGAWKWTASPTPGSVNALKMPVLTALSKSKASNGSKSSGAVKSATSKTSTASTKAPKTSPTASTKPTNFNDKKVVSVPSLHPLILAVVGGLGVLYAAYEYRQDIANKIYQFRRDRKNRRANRTSLERR